MNANLKRCEDTEQIGVMEWAQANICRWPELKLLHHIPNGGKRNRATAARLKEMGVKPGVPDLCLPVARNGYAGLYIEMKYGRGRPTEKQKEWIRALTDQGYRAVVCCGGVEATQELEDYLTGMKTILIRAGYDPGIQGQDKGRTGYEDSCND